MLSHISNLLRIFKERRERIRTGPKAKYTEFGGYDDELLSGFNVNDTVLSEYSGSSEEE